MLKVASWNVNSLKIRLDQVLLWMKSNQVDLVAVQETKVTNENFPQQVFTEQGYHVAFSGQKTFNGMAIISRTPIHEVLVDIPDFEDIQRRIMAATINDIRVINLYVPNGSTVDSDKYVYKLNWLDKITAFIQQQLQQYTQVMVLGDFNIAPDDIDVHDPMAWEGSVLVSPKERAALRKILALGLTDSFRHLNPSRQQFSWWDYRQAAFRRNRGLRIDLILLNKTLQVNCLDSQIDATPRQHERPSDHAPVWVSLDV